MSLLDRLKQLFADAKQGQALPTAKPDQTQTSAPSIAASAEAVAETEQAAIERRRKKRVNAAPGTKVLVIDDSTTILAALGRMLRQNGYEIMEAEDAEKGIELAHAKLPAIIFLDIVLPGMSGFTALRHLRHDPRY
jgi:PleD family two-component response regulator